VFTRSGAHSPSTNTSITQRMQAATTMRQRNPPISRRNAPNNKREMFTAAQSIRSFLDTGSVISVSEELNCSFSTVDEGQFDGMLKDVATSSQSSKHSEQTGNSSARSEQKFGVVESARVKKWRLAVIASILVIGLVVSTLTYVTLRREIIADSNDAVRASGLNR
jgi:hypothetical protein